MARFNWEKTEKKRITSVKLPDHNIIDVNLLGKRLVRKNKPRVKL